MQKKTNNLPKFLSQFLLLMSTISLFVPFTPKMPASGLDPSWALGLNQAVAQGLAFGKEILFTLGPYSSIYTQFYHPATDFMMLSGSAYLAVSYWLGLIFLMKQSPWYWIVAFCVPFLGMLYARDSLFFSYPLLIGLVSFKWVSLENQPSNTRYASILFAPLGLYPLIKGSILIFCLLIIALCFILFLTNKRYKLALICLVSPTASLILFWLLSGQSIIYLPHYVVGTLSLATHFTEAMSSEGNTMSAYEITLYLVTSLCLLLAILWQKQPVRGTKIFLFALFFIFLFLSFKTGFTRHIGHVFIPSTSILLAALFVPFIVHSKINYLLILCSSFSWYFMNSHYTQISIPNNILSFYTSVLHGLKNRIQDPSWSEKNYAFTTDFLRAQANFPQLTGTTDIYSYNQAYLISSQNSWSPRPIFQSYSVFTPDLARDNSRHLQGKHKPDNIIFKLEPIDRRVPSLEDGASWPLLLANYQPTHLKPNLLWPYRSFHTLLSSFIPWLVEIAPSTPYFHKISADSFLFLHKRKVPIKMIQNVPISEQHIFGESIELPQNRNLLFCRMEIKSTVLGILATFFFKPEHLLITFNLKNGSTKHYRLIASMAKSTFLLSPLIENTYEFSLLYKKNNALNEKMVTSFSVTTNQSANWHWNNAYTLIYLQSNSL